MTRRRCFAALVFVGSALAVGGMYVYGGWARDLGPLPYEGPEWVAGAYVAVGAVGVFACVVRRRGGGRLRRRVPLALLAAVGWVALTPLPYVARWAWLWQEVRSLPLPVADHRGPGDRVDVVRFDGVADFRAGYQTDTSYRECERIIRDGLEARGWTLLNTYLSLRDHRYAYLRGRERLTVRLRDRGDGGSLVELAKWDRRLDWFD